MPLGLKLLEFGECDRYTEENWQTDPAFFLFCTSSEGNGMEKNKSKKMISFE